MGSASASDRQQDELTVLVTGFEPFEAEHPRNPSWEIAATLPAYLPQGRPAGPTPAPAPGLPPVRILVHPQPVRVSYAAVRDAVPGLWDGRRVDFAVHMGMAGPHNYYCIERKGHRDGYALPDVDGELLHDDERHKEQGDDWIWHGVPSELETDLDLDDVLRRWRAHAPDNFDLRISTNAGHYLCDFIYFSSLAHLWKAGQYRRVVFLHVPSASDGPAVAAGRELTLQLIRSICESERTRAKRHPAGAQ